jgi:Glycosyl hydrolase family 63 N-terminal domain
VVRTLALGVMVGGDWGVRIRGKTETNETVTNVYFYAGLEGSGDLHLASQFHEDVVPRKNVVDVGHRR